MTGSSALTSALADRYRTERELGAGGMATVYLAHETDGSRAEARARPRNGILKDAARVACFSTECLAEPALQGGTAVPARRAL